MGRSRSFSRYSFVYVAETFAASCRLGMTRRCGSCTACCIGGMGLALRSRAWMRMRWTPRI